MWTGPTLSRSPTLILTLALMLNLIPTRSSQSSNKNLIGGGAAACSFFSRHTQGDHVDPSKRLYSGLVDCFKKTMAEGGAAFYKGFTPSITRAMPVNGAIFTGFTAAQRALA